VKPGRAASLLPDGAIEMQAAARGRLAVPGYFVFGRPNTASISRRNFTVLSLAS
jgi:hypothetical protein